VARQAVYVQVTPFQGKERALVKSAGRGAKAVGAVALLAAARHEAGMRVLMAAETFGLQLQK
jgi:hypothetical protein